MVNNYDGAGFYLDVLCSLVFGYDEETMKSLEELYFQFNLQVKDNLIFYSIDQFDSIQIEEWNRHEFYKLRNHHLLKSG